MAFGAGKLFTPNSQRLRGNGQGSSYIPPTIIPVLDSYKQFSFEVTTPYATGANLNFWLVFSNPITPSQFTSSTGPLTVFDTFDEVLQGNVAVDSNGQANITISLDTSNFPTFTDGTTVSCQIFRGIFDPYLPGNNYAVDILRAFTLDLSNQRQLEIVDQGGSGVVTTYTFEVDVTPSFYSWGDYFPAAVAQGFDGTDFTHMKIIKYQYDTSLPFPFGPGIAKWQSTFGFVEPTFATNQSMPIGAIVSGGNRMNTDLYAVTSPTIQPLDFLISPSGYLVKQDIRVTDGRLSDPYASLEYSTTSSGTQTLTPKPSPQIPVTGYPNTPARCPVSRPSSLISEVVLWYPLRGTAGQFVTVSVT